MSDFGLTVTVREGNDQGPPIEHAEVSLAGGAVTGPDGTAVVDTVYVSVTAEGYQAYINQPYHRPSLNAPVNISLQRKQLPSEIPLDQLAQLKGSMWTARLDVDYGPRPHQPDNILALEYIYCYPDHEQERMIEAYKSRGYTHCCIGPINAQSYHGQYPDISFEDDFDGYLDVLEKLWNSGLIPINFVKGDTWGINELIAHEELFMSPRAQSLMRVVVPCGWEPDRNTPSMVWKTWLKWGARVFPNSLRLVHMASDHDAPGIGGEADNAELWKRVVSLIHGWLVQSSAFKSPDTVNSDSGLTAYHEWVNSFDMNIRGSYYDRFHRGYAGWPTHSAWGPDTPIKVYAGEYASYWCYWDNRPEEEAQFWGDQAMSVGADGYLDGGTV